MIKVRDLLVGEETGGFACGPVSGADYMELQLEADGKALYLHMSHFEDAYQLRICEKSLMDLEKAYWGDGDGEACLDEMEALTRLLYEWSDDELTEYHLACRKDWGKGTELITAVMKTYERYGGNEDDFFAWFDAFREEILDRELSKIRIPVTLMPWNADEVYEDENVYAHDWSMEETDPSGWVDVVMAECIAENKMTLETVYVYADTPGDEVYNLCVSPVPLMKEMLESGEAIPPAEILDRAVEHYGDLEQARDSFYYEVFRRLLYTLEN